jgi:hypothetical protein
MGALLCLFLAFQKIDDNFSDLRGEDNASYVLLAKAIATGQGYADVNLPGAPPHTQYPPLFPLLLSPIFYLYGYNFMLMRLLVMVLGLGAVYLTYRVFSASSGKRAGALAAVLVGTNFQILFFMGEILTELPYLFFSLLALYLLSKVPSGERGSLFAAIVGVAAAYLTKSIGMTLAVAAVLALLAIAVTSGSHELRSGLKKFLYFAVLGFAPFAIWSARNSAYSTGITTYQSIFMQADYYDLSKGTAGLDALLKRALENLSWYADAVPATLLTYGEFNKMLPEAVYKWASIGVLAVMAVGFVYCLLRKRRVMDFYVLFSLLLLAVWPTYGAGAARRYAIPFIPFFYYYFFHGAGFIASPKEHLLTGWPGREPRLPYALLAVLLCFNLLAVRKTLMPPASVESFKGALSALVGNYDRKFETAEYPVMTSETIKSSAPCYDRYLSAAVLLRRAMNADDLVMTRKPEVVSIISGRHAVRFPYTPDRAEMAAFVKRAGVTHVMLDGCYDETRRYLAPYAEERGSGFEVWIGAGSESAGIMKLGR